MKIIFTEELSYNIHCFNIATSNEGVYANADIKLTDGLVSAEDLADLDGTIKHCYTGSFTIEQNENDRRTYTLDYVGLNAFFNEDAADEEHEENWSTITFRFKETNVTE